jgi:hypothetical protein
MNKSIGWLYSQFQNDNSIGTAQCYLCATRCTEQHTVARGLADTFNSHYLAACPTSAYLCDACQWYFDNKAGHPEFRKMSLIVQPHSWQNWQREQMKDDILHALRHGLEEDCYLVISLSKKKHVLLQAPLNATRSHQLSIQVEEQVAHLNLSIWEAIEMPFMGLLQLGHGKGEILSGNLYGQTLKKHGQWDWALLLSRQLEQWRNSPQIELYSYITIVEKEEKDATGERPSAGDGPGAISAGTRDTKSSSKPAESRVERHRQRISEQVSHGDLENVRRESSDGGTNYEQLDLFSL